MAVFGLLAASCTSVSPVPEEAAPITVAPAAPESSDGVDAVNIGIVLNTASLTADRDLRLAEVMAASAGAVNELQPVEVFVETVTISDPADAPAAVVELVNRGVTVIATSCDDSTMGVVVETALAEQLLAVTGCVTIPKPELDISDRLFIDLASLDDAPSAMATWAQGQDIGSIALLSSELIPDVEQTCSDFEKFATAAPAGIEIVAKASFVELVDDPNAVVDSLADRLPEADAIVVCALAPTLGDVVDALRNSGLDQPVLVPWFGQPQAWNDSISDVFILSPSSVDGDDPASEVVDLYDELTAAEPTDVVAADTLAVVAAAANASQSVGSRRLANAMRGETINGVSGTLAVGDGVELPVTRSYRVLEVSNGRITVVDTVGG